MNTNFRNTPWRWALICLMAAAGSACADSVVNSVHNLSASGPGTIKANSEKNACVFCHTVHRTTGDHPLWNHSLSGITNYVVYSSMTLKAVVGQPNGSSRLCLSCHDGTVALGMVNSHTSPISMANGVTTMPSGPSNLGTDLSGDHPISFVYDAALVAKDSNLNDPTTLNHKVKLDPSSQVQCASCHNAHDNQFGNFLVMDNTASALCVVCHVTPNWSGSAHAMSTKVLPAVLAQRIAQENRSKKLTKKTVGANGCEICHATHFAGARERLMRFDAPEQNCLVCHNGSMPAKNVAADFQKPSVHPVTLNAKAHSPQEDPVNPSVRHVACADCHNPHAAGTAAKSSARVGGALLGVTGMNSSGAIIKAVSKEYELCYRCHADSIARGQPRVNRQWSETNKRLQFSPGNQSFHPVQTLGKNPNVPSLITPWRTSSTVTCEDCHNSDQAASAGGSGASGPHGSIYSPLLERQLILTDFTPENPANYALCYKCHSRDSILGNQSFKYHSKHIVDDKTACTTCHDSHGVATNQRLINFNVNYVSPVGANPIQYIPGGLNGPTCILKCHDYDHQPAGPSAQRLKLLKTR